MGKGASFEREISKKLSRWWTKGEREDVYWRSSQSGGRATERAKKGKTTYGSYGDITAVDPIGEPLLKLFTIELKRGYSKGSPFDLVESPASKASRPFEQAILQAIRGYKMAGSKGWMLICQRDRKLPMVYIGMNIFTLFEPSTLIWLFLPPCAQFSILLHKRKIRFAAFQLDDFLSRISPREVQKIIL